MKESIKTLKANLKAIAKKIKENKNIRKKSHPHHDKYIGDWSVLCLSQEFRHKHVAYCLARGRKLEQVDSGKNLDMDRVNWILKTMEPESKEKLYVVVNETLSIEQRAVQAAHATAEFLRKNPHTMWKNGHIVLLQDKPNYNKNMYCWVSGYCETAEFKEPDLGNIVTAYAVFGERAERAMKTKVLLRQSEVQVVVPKEEVKDNDNKTPERKSSLLRQLLNLVQ